MSNTLPTEREKGLMLVAIVDCMAGLTGMRPPAESEQIPNEMRPHIDRLMFEMWRIAVSARPEVACITVAPDMVEFATAIINVDKMARDGNGGHPATSSALLMAQLSSKAFDTIPTGNEMNFGTFFIWKPDVLTFRLLGFGLFACNRHALPIISKETPWMIPISPSWHFCLVAPWL